MRSNFLSTSSHKRGCVTHWPSWLRSGPQGQRLTGWMRQASETLCYMSCWWVHLARRARSFKTTKDHVNHCILGQVSIRQRNVNECFLIIFNGKHRNSLLNNNMDTSYLLNNGLTWRKTSSTILVAEEKPLGLW